MKLLTTLAVAEATEFVTVNRVTIVEGIDCPKTTSAETRTAVEEAFNLTKWPNSASEWITGECDDSTGKGDLRALHLAAQKTNSGFYWQLETDVGVDQREELTLKYDMKMKEGYEFVKGGKLPGLFGGSVSCGGGANAAELGCFSTRLMWRREGDAELYLYAPYDQAEGFCDRPNYHCNFDYGNSVERGCFVFQPGQWHQLEERVKLNTPGQKDGVFMLFNNGQLVLHLTDLNYREVDTIKIMGMHFNTFYGGGDISWYPTELNWADFKNFAFDDYSDSLLPSDVDNCPSATCDANATCTSQYRGFTCQCNEGYEGDGFTCTQTTTTTPATTSTTTTTPATTSSTVVTSTIEASTTSTASTALECGCDPVKVASDFTTNGDGSAGSAVCTKVGKANGKGSIWTLYCGDDASDHPTRMNADVKMGKNCKLNDILNCGAATTAPPTTEPTAPATPECSFIGDLEQANPYATFTCIAEEGKKQTIECRTKDGDTSIKTGKKKSLLKWANSSSCKERGSFSCKCQEQTSVFTSITCVAENTYSCVKDNGLLETVKVKKCKKLKKSKCARRN